MRVRSPWLATGSLIFATAIWGSTFIVVQDGINAMPMMMFMGWRFIIATAAMVAIRPSALKMTRKTFLQGVGIGIALTLGYITQTYGLYSTSATVSGFITGMFVVMTPLLAAIIYRTRIGLFGWFAVALAMAGVGLISLRGWEFGGGEAWTLLGAFCFSFQIMWLSKWATPETSYSIATTQVATTAVIFVVGGLALDGWVVPPNSAVWTAVVFLAVFASAFAFIIQTWSQSQMTPTRAAVVLSLEPVFAGAFGVLVAGDSITWRVLLGGAAILAAMFLVELKPQAAAPLSQPHHLS